MRVRFGILLFITAVFLSAGFPQNADDKTAPLPKLLSAPEPVYPKIDKDSAIGGHVTLAVAVDENGDVITARSMTGHPLLRNSAEIAACGAKFKPTVVDGSSVRVSGLVSYAFLRGRF